MKLFFEETHRIPNLTTVECLNMLEEERHHTDFLDGLKNEILSFINLQIKQMINNNNFTFSEIYENPNQYFDKLIINVKLNKRSDYYGKKHSNGQYYSTFGLQNGKLHLPELDIETAIGLNGEYDDIWVRLIVEHEINHLYDDWQWQITGHEPLTDNTEWNHGDGRFIQENLGNKSNPLIMAIAWCVYASLWTETNSYLNQAFKEFEYVKMKPSNVHQKIKSTTSYRNYTKQMIDLKWYAGKEDENTLQEKVLSLFKTYGRISVPKPSNHGDYKERLIKWSEGIHNKFMKRYCGIVSLYLDRNFDKRNK